MLAVQQGNFTKFVEYSGPGVSVDLRDAVNSLIIQLRFMISEVSCVSREVGIKGKLGGQAVIPFFNADRGYGEWKILVDNVNLMAMNLMHEVRGISEVTKAIRNSDFTQRVTTSNAKGKILKLNQSINDTAEKLHVFADEWLSTENNTLQAFLSISSMYFTLKGHKLSPDPPSPQGPVSGRPSAHPLMIAVAITAVARGDLTQKIVGVSVGGRMLNLVNIINEMIDLLSIFAHEVNEIVRNRGLDDQRRNELGVSSVQGVLDQILLSVSDSLTNADN
ncbi:hypothetical protein D9758_004334 [Tetrapyrgos nigripes]|uniref:HAMP domain-containing protein n=1 Tax=Tetrapyrgos nigripes TaxID=182062 RepID=A0A8H5LSQ3_9AGAR|nr:hypothetical protein D9758_004334 [Tetrapyrgos nigripes]